MMNSPAGKGIWCKVRKHWFRRFTPKVAFDRCLLRVRYAYLFLKGVGKGEAAGFRLPSPAAFLFSSRPLRGVTQKFALDWPCGTCTGVSGLAAASIIASTVSRTVRRTLQLFTIRLLEVLAIVTLLLW